jgi:Ras-related protein Rab-23
VYTSDYKKTIGVDFLERKITFDGEDMRLMIWDTAGQEEFADMTRVYYQGAAACVVAFSTTDLASFKAGERWRGTVKDQCDNIPMVLVQNKVDLIDQAVMSKEEANALADRTGLRFYRTSVQENYQVDEIFKYLADCYLQRIRAEEAAAIAQKGSAKPKYADTGAPKQANFQGATAKGGGTVSLSVPRKRTAEKKSGFSCTLL